MLSFDNFNRTTTNDLGGLFEALKDEDVKIALCTSDSREGTLEFLERESLTHMVDRVVCGDDKDGKPKPDPHNAMLICRELGVSPRETIMVGDTPADTLMGQQAGLGLTVGVLSGVGGIEDLADADVIVSDVRECVEMILPHPEGPEASVRSRVHQVTSRGLAKIAGVAGGPLGAGPLFGMGQRRGMATSAVVRAPPAEKFSHIVVGAGSAGCVLTNRLTEDRRVH